MTIKPDQQPAAAPPPPATPPLTPTEAPPRPTRFGGLWFTLALGAVVLVLLLVFVLMNGNSVQIHLYGAHFTAPLGVAILLAAALGVLLVVVPGAGRILQLKRAARKLHKEHLHLADQLQEQVSAPATPDPARTAPTAPTPPASAAPPQAAANPQRQDTPFPGDRRGDAAG